MYYDVGPKGDSRHARAIMGNLSKELALFLDKHTKASRTNDAGYFLEANQARSQVEIARLSVIDQIQAFPQAIQDQMTTAVGRVSIKLEQHPPFPEPSILNDDALPNFIHRIQHRGTTSEVNAPIRRESLPAIKAPPPSEANAFRHSNVRAHSITNIPHAIARITSSTPAIPRNPIDDIIANAPPVGTPSIVGTRSIASSASHSLYKSTIDPNEANPPHAVHQTSPRDPRQSPSIRINQIVEFPPSADQSIEEKRALLRKRFDDLIVEKLAAEKQAKLKADRINEEYKQTMREMERLDLGPEAGAEAPEEDLLEELGAVIENHERRINTENWVETVASVHSAGLVPAAEPEGPLIISATPNQTRPTLYRPDRPPTPVQAISNPTFVLPPTPGRVGVMPAASLPANTAVHAVNSQPLIIYPSAHPTARFSNPIQPTSSVPPTFQCHLPPPPVLAPQPTRPTISVQPNHQK